MKSRTGSWVPRSNGPLPGCGRSTGRASCYGTSRAIPTRKSRPHWSCRWARSRPISIGPVMNCAATWKGAVSETRPNRRRSEEHTSELQSRLHLVCRLLLEKKKNIIDLQYYSKIYDTSDINTISIESLRTRHD